jgi:hypothetical protein
MCYLINAWLERRDPYIDIIDKKGGEVILHLQGAVLRTMIDDGILECTTLAAASPDQQKQLIRDLLLYSCEWGELEQIAAGETHVAMSQL